MSNEAQEILNEIQFKTGKSLEQIAEEIGYSRPYLNNVKLKGGTEKIIGILKEKYYNILQKAPHGSGGQASGITGAVSAAQYIDSILEQKRILEVQNEFLRRNFESSLISIREGQQQAGVQLKTLLWYSALVASGGDPKKAEKAMVEINNRMAQYAGVKSKVGIQNDGGK